MQQGGTADEGRVRIELLHRRMEKVLRFVYPAAGRGATLCTTGDKV